MGIEPRPAALEANALTTRPARPVVSLTVRQRSVLLKAMTMTKIAIVMMMMKSRLSLPLRLSLCADGDDGDRFSGYC